MNQLFSFNQFTDTVIVVNTTIEERVTILELQVTELTGDIEAVEDEVILISTDQLTQNERILELEMDANGNNSNYFFACFCLKYYHFLLCVKVYHQFK